MTTPWLILTIVVAVLFIAFAVQVAARQLQRFPVDPRSAGALVDITRRTSWTVRPVEFEHVTAIVTESLSSDAVARSKLWPMLEELNADAPQSLTRASPAASSAKLAGRRSRSRQLEERLDELEEAWGLTEGDAH